MRPGIYRAKDGRLARVSRTAIGLLVTLPCLHALIWGRGGDETEVRSWTTAGPRIPKPSPPSGQTDTVVRFPAGPHPADQAPSLDCPSRGQVRRLVTRSCHT